MATGKASSYTAEISQMLFVFGEVKDPDPDTVRFIEDVVRCQVAEVVVQARALAQRRGARAPSTEDLIFLIRHDRGKVNRLRTYLGWKEVRKKAREDGEEKDIEAYDEQATELKSKQKLKLKIPWDITSIYGDVILEDDNEEDDEEDREAYEASEKRLKEADELTRHMTREEYKHFSECRQASFTYRKSKKFREFIGLSNFLEGTPKDEVVDVLGFLSYEMVRALCERGIAVKRDYQVARAAKDDGLPQTDTGGPVGKRSREDGEGSEKSGPGGGGSGGSPSKRRKRAVSSDDEDDGSAAFRRPIPLGLFTAPARPSGTSLPTSARGTPAPVGFGDEAVAGNAAASGSGEAAEPEVTAPAAVERTPLGVADVEDAYSAMQMGRVKLKMSGMRNFNGGGIFRTKVTLI